MRNDDDVHHRDEQHRRGRDRDRDRNRRSMSPHQERKSRDREREEHFRSRPEDRNALQKEPEKPNYKQSGVLAKESNMINGVAIKYVEPENACEPKDIPHHRLFVFEGDNIVDKIDLNTRSWYLLGRDPVCHVRLEGSSISKQHAVIQYRMIHTTNKYGEKSSKCKCYLIDIESSYGTKLNLDEIPKSRYIELKNKDMIQFGGITAREYVLIIG